MSFEEFYKLTFDNLYRYFYYKSVSNAFIEDLVQESYLRFYGKYEHKLNDQSESTKIIYGISLNVYREWVREQITQNKVSYNDEMDYAIEDESEDICKEYDDYETDNFETVHQHQKELVKEAIGKLNDKVRDILQYRFIDGLSRREIAEKLGMNEKDVHTYQKRGIKYLKKSINSI